MSELNDLVNEFQRVRTKYGHVGAADSEVRIILKELVDDGGEINDDFDNWALYNCDKKRANRELTGIGKKILTYTRDNWKDREDREKLVDKLDDMLMEW